MPSKGIFFGPIWGLLAIFDHFQKTKRVVFDPKGSQFDYITAMTVKQRTETI
jgi:hypothetical protein